MSYDEGLTNPFDGSVRDPMPETPSMGEVFAEAIRQTGLAMRVALPASVAAVRGNQLVDIQPLLKTRYVDGRVVTMPIVPNALVCCPAGANWSMKVPLAVGDTGLAVFCDRSLDAWAAGDGSAADPQDSRTHNLTDAVFLPGLLTMPSQTTDTTGDLVLTNGAGSIHVQAGGTFKVTNGSNELVDLVKQLSDMVTSLCDVLATQAFTVTALGPMPFIASTVAALEQAKATSQAIASKVQTLRGT